MDTKEIVEEIKEDIVKEQKTCSENNIELKKENKSKTKLLKEIYSKIKGIGIFGVILLMIILSIILVINSSKLNNSFYEGEVYDEVVIKLKIQMKEAILKFQDFDYLKKVFLNLCDVAGYTRILQNTFIVLSSMFFLYAITSKPKFSIIFSLILWSIIDIVNYIVFDLRGTPFSLSDIYSFTTAMAVVGGMKVEFGKVFWKFLISIIISVFIVSILKFKKDKNKYVNIAKRIFCLAFCIIMITTVYNSNNFKNDSYWNLEETYRQDGIAFGILRQTKDFFIKKPEGYSIEKAEEILNRYKPEIKNNKEKINIFVIANESFADINKTYNLGLKDNMPFYNTITENVIKGTAYSSVLGGGTATAEWEFLTGNSAAFVPQNSIPFLVYIRDKKDTIASELLKQNYTTNSIHSYYERCYNRASVYSRLGFENRIFKEQMAEHECIRPEYPSDATTYEHIIKEFENRDKTKSFFGYVLTIQNHIAYNTPQSIYKNKGYVQGNYAFDQYLSLINDSDTDLKNFIDYFSKEEEKTILLFFGDHQPNVQFIHEPIDEWLVKQKVPYMLWANFDIEEKQGEDISFNYLSTLIYDYANLDTTSYIEFLKELKEKIPVYTAKGYKGDNGKTYNLGDKSSPYYEDIKEYNILQYYFMFDK